MCLGTFNAQKSFSLITKNQTNFSPLVKISDHLTHNAVLRPSFINAWHSYLLIGDFLSADGKTVNNTKSVSLLNLHSQKGDRNFDHFKESICKLCQVIISM